MDVSIDGEWMGTCSGYRRIYEDDELIGIELVEFKSVDEVEEGEEG